MNDHAVVIAGGGPTGLMLAGELALAGVDAVIVERRTNQDVDGSRAGGLHARTIEVLDHRGIAERFLAPGQARQTQAFVEIPLDLTDFPSRRNHGLLLEQQHIERLLADWVVDDLGVPIVRGRAVTGIAPDDDGVTVAMGDGTTLRTSYLVGCDGGRSVVRKAAGIDFPGIDASASFVIAEVRMTETPPGGMHREGGGIGPVGDGWYRAVVREASVDHDGDATLADLRAALLHRYGTDFGVHDPTWLSRFTDASRQAATYRHGRVLLAGDAAHVHPPHGGQGLNLGVQDAVNLGWKLAQVVLGVSPDGLLDTYHAERHPVGAAVLQHTMAMVAFSHGDDRHEALRSLLAVLLAYDEPRRRLGGTLSGLGIHYDLGAGHPLVGWRMPDLDLATGAGRVYELLHDARPVLLSFDGPYADARVKVVEAAYDGPWEVPVVGEVPAPAAVLIRPDGYVAWAGDLADPALPDAIGRWLG